MEDLLHVLNKIYGYESFRPYQEEVIRLVLEGQDTLAVMPTGGGKSLCYQLPSFLLPQPTLVISPLIALMKDQIDGLPSALREFSTLINSSLDPGEAEKRLAGMEQGRYKLIYVAPERLRQQSFIGLLNRMRLSLVVVDEAHCVSFWGHDFRPDYLFIRRAVDMLSKGQTPPTMLAVTATATPKMQAEIENQLGRKFHRIYAPVYRSNLCMEAMPCSSNTGKMRALREICHAMNGAGIIYVNSRKKCEEIADFLLNGGFQAGYYHAGMESEERRLAQERFMLGKMRIIVATVAFGMGVDKANIRFVVHSALPGSLESYVQEAGRAGRDGKPSRCILLHSHYDRNNLERWMKQEAVSVEDVKAIYRVLQARLGKSHGAVSAEYLIRTLSGEKEQLGEEVRMRVSISLLEKCGLVIRHPDIGGEMHIEMLTPHREARKVLDAMLLERWEQARLRMDEVFSYAYTRECRQCVISRYFGQRMQECGKSCDVCLGIAKMVEMPKLNAPSAQAIPDIGRLILQTINDLPHPETRSNIGKILAGNPNSPVRKDTCPRFGMLEGMAQNTITTLVGELLDMGLLDRDYIEDLPVVIISAIGKEALAKTDMILHNPEVSKGTRYVKPQIPIRPQVETPPIGDGEDDRFEKLRVWRRITAQKMNVPPYSILSDQVLRIIAKLNPKSLESLRVAYDTLQDKLNYYGNAIMDVLKNEGN